MTERIAIPEALVVEGHYDATKLEQIFKTQVIATNGFGIFKDRPLQRLIAEIAAKQGVVILTDSDAAGFKIRAFVAQLLKPEQVKHAYIPEVIGKERRKDTASKSGLLGVEGINETLLKKVVTSVTTATVARKNDFNHTLFYSLGLSGKKDSALKRRALLSHLGLPTRLSTSAMIKLLPSLLTTDQLIEILNNISIE